MSRGSDEQAEATLYYCRDALPIALKLRAPRDIPHAFFGWRNYPPAVDAGVPAAVARVFSTVLCGRFHLTFIGDALTKANASSHWSRTGEYWSQTQTRMLKRAIPLIWTQDVRVAQRAFDQGWETEGQFILLSVGPDPIPFDAYALQGDGERVLAFVQVRDHLSGALLPGVDGDVAGLYLHDGPLLKEILERDLVEACQREGVTLRPTSGREFVLWS